MDTALKLYRPAPSATEALVREHMPMVKRVAVHLKVRLPPFMDIEELVQVGMVGLIEAAQAFDPAKGEEFERFALSRIRGAMVDEVRRMTGMPRSAVAFQRTEELAVPARSPRTWAWTWRSSTRSATPRTATRPIRSSSSTRRR